MADKRSRKQNWKKSSRPIKSKLTNASHHLESDKIVSSQTYDNNSTPLMSSSSSAAPKQNPEGIILIWYDPQIDKTDATKLTIDELQKINDCRVIQSSDKVECVKDIQSMENEKIFLITPGKAVNSLLQEIASLKQVDSIFIFCLNVNKYHHLSQKYDKIIEIYSDRSVLIDSIKENVRHLQKNLTTFSFYKKHTEKNTRDISKESAEFLWFQLLKDVLLRMPRSDQAKQELIDFSRQIYRRDPEEQRNIIEFEQSYQSDKSIYWYTKDSFLYKLVNKALRTEDVGQLQTFRFFIGDLSSKLAEIHRNKQETTVTLYRGLKLENDELKRLEQNVGGIIAANGFLSTSRLRDVAVEFVMRPAKRTNTVPVVYEIEYNLNTSGSVVFADIVDYSEFAQEQEVLFDLGSTFKIESIITDEQLKMIVVKLTATDAGMKMAQKYIKLNRDRNQETTPDILFGVLLIQMGKYDQSLTYFEDLLNRSNSNIDTPRIYHEIGSAYFCIGELDKAFENADRAYQKMIKTKQSRIKDSSRPLEIMGHVYLGRKNDEKSLDLYFEALDVREKFYGRKHLDTAIALHHIGIAYFQKTNYPKSLEYYKKAFHIREKQLPYVHLDIATSLNNIGLVHWKMKDVQSALDCHRQALDIRKQLLPADHNDIIQSLHNLAHIFYEGNHFGESLKYFTQILTIEKIKFDPNNHDNLVSLLKKRFGPKSGEIQLSDLLCVKRLNHEPCPRPRSSAPMCMGLPPSHMVSINPTLSIAAQKQIELKKQEDLSILKDFIKTLDSDSDYHRALKKVRKILMASAESPIAGYNRTEYIMTCLGDLVKNAYNSDDKSMNAFRFYNKVRFILENNISHLADTKSIERMCSERIKQKKIHDRSILKELIDILRGDGDYDMALETVKILLMESSKPFTSGYNHIEYLMNYFRTLVMNAHDSDDESITARDFYEKVQHILESVISHWADTNDIQIIFSERIGYIRQINNYYEIAVKSFERSVKIQREHKQSLIDVPDTLNCIGLLHMTLGNHKSALVSFNEALQLLESNSAQENRVIKLLHKRIDQATEGFKLDTDSLQ